MKTLSEHITESFINEDSKKQEISKDSNAAEFERIVNLPGWINQKGESISAEKIMSSKSAKKISYTEKYGYHIQLTSGYWFDLPNKN